MWGERGQAALSEANFDIVERLTSYAEQQGHSILELAFGWLVTKPYISCVIAGATSASQVKSNVDASAWELTEEQMTIVNDISKR